MTIIAHRGASGTEPENTLRAFRRAIALGPKWIECDMRLTRDGIPVVIHDATLRRTTNGHGLISRKTLKEIRSLNAGKGERIPTLAETVALCTEHRANLIIEIKDSHALEPTIDLVRAYCNTPLQLIVSSFSTSVLRRARTLAPHLPTAIITTGLLIGRDAWVRLAHKADTSIVCANARLVTKQRIEAAHRAGLKVFAWTINSLTQAQRLKALGIDGIFTDYSERYIYTSKAPQVQQTAQKTDTARAHRLPNGRYYQ